ncbi:protein-disulfide reductase DsbD [Beggiatoa leptomitoformis]|uniref:Thiol:disulfide interchange protein DsbD n=1 Tax=Beggiatoa leptomitoformis TaxID=288004 RepID=A0A2N9YHH1_9GAMM|nr:protein-disulfide reductase DsbD [Beggiatoa leptomitoformis]AUI69950.1 protein-disulfide reductase DsbD [Beggiatoa leptomitoformis]QGX03657.1 protein-disulfide reductase DsbD [Beggiatoa leptomitoformis]
MRTHFFAYLCYLSFSVWMGIAVANPPTLNDMLQQSKHNSKPADNGLQPLANGIPPASETATQPALNEEEDFLDPEKAFFLTVTTINHQTVRATWLVAEGYYLYAQKMHFVADNASIGNIALPPSKTKDDPLFGKVQVYEQTEVIITLTLENIRSHTLNLQVDYQGCATAGLCYPPMSKTLSLVLPAPTTPAETITPVSTPTAVTPALPNLSEQDQIAQALMQDNIFYTLLLFFGFGLLLSFTPCVFPMIPILSSIIVGQGKQLSTRSAFLLSLIYVLAMALTYTVAGVFAGMVGENLQAAFQEPIVLIVFALIFVALAFSMFGFYDLQMPNALQSKLTELSNHQQGGTWIGVAMMGFFSALIVGPCVAAPLAGILIYISQTGDAVFGGLALFSLSLGMGIPLLIIGTSAGQLLPRAGLWMDAIKNVFGVLLLATAWWLLERLLADFIVLMGWATLLIVSAVYMGALDSLQAGMSHWRRLWKGIGVIFLVYGVLLMIAASQGGQAVLYPLRLQNGSTSTATINSSGLSFQTVKGIEGLNQALAMAKQAGKPVMFDFYADWCVSCKEMEAFTFTDRNVQESLKDFVLLQADVTANDAQDKALYKQFGIFGPPAILFYGSDGIEKRAYRVVGFTPANTFFNHIERFKQTL